MKILIILETIMKNRGSEALVRGLIKICKKIYNDCYIAIASGEADFPENIEYKIDGVNEYIKKRAINNKNAIKNIVAVAARKYFKAYNFYGSILYSNLVNRAKEFDLVIIIGADNYDKKSYGMFPKLHSLNLQLKKKTKSKLCLYDCSLDKDDINDELIEDFNLFDLVTVREKISLNNCKGKFNTKLKYYPDPAFVMNASKTELPSIFQKGQVVGINLSSLILNSKHGNKDLIISSYENLIKYIIEKTDYQVLLIPHVMSGADLDILKILYDKFRNSNRCELLNNESLSSPQLKYIISKCSLFVGARTHATIAAYSSCVPTLVLGYSVKSRGIATDLFGTEKNYVVSASDLKNDNQLVDAFKWLLSNKSYIEAHLNNVIPTYILKAESVGMSIKELLGGK